MKIPIDLMLMFALSEILNWTINNNNKQEQQHPAAAGLCLGLPGRRGQGKQHGAAHRTAACLSCYAKLLV